MKDANIFCLSGVLSTCMKSPKAVFFGGSDVAHSVDNAVASNPCFLDFGAEEESQRDLTLLLSVIIITQALHGSESQG
jgi:hypothetical protein